MDSCCLRKAEKVLGLNILKDLVNIKMKLYVQVNLHTKLNPMFILMKLKKQQWNKKEIIARKIIK
jgi:hypothetical protein